MAPSGANVYCTSCGKHYDIEPHKCECGCLGFTYTSPKMKDWWTKAYCLADELRTHLSTKPPH